MTEIQQAKVGITIVIPRVGSARADREGWGEQSFVHARSWLELSAANYWPNAMDDLALYYRQGLGVAKDPARAFDHGCG